MSEYLSDAEQVERLKRWIKTYGSSALTGVLLALSAYFGWSWWQNRQSAENYALATSFQGVADAASKAQAAPEDQAARSKFLSQAAALNKAHPDSIYSLQTLLLEARLASERSDYAGAIKALEQASKSPIDDAGLKQIISLRLARAQHEQGQQDAALTTLAKVTDPAFVASRDELKGDVLLAKQDRKGAQTAYQQAWAALVKREEPRQTIKFKLESLGADVKDIEAPSPIKAPVENAT